MRASVDEVVHLAPEVPSRGATERLSELKDMLDQGLIEDNDYTQAKTRILSEL